jgi:mono/diheme cytochrome c family protein
MPTTTFPIAGLRIVIIALIALLGLTACRSGPDEPGTGLAPETVALGERVYQANCAACHGANLEGEPDWKVQNDDGSFRAPPHTADGHTWHHSDASLIDAIEKGGSRFDGLNIGGTSNMPAYADILSPEEIQAVLVFLKSQWPDEIRAQQEQRTQLEAAQ